MSTGEAFRKVLESIKTVLFALSAVFLTCFVAWAAGITVPEGSRLNIDAGELHVEPDNEPGSIVNYGVIRTTTGTIRLNGDWAVYGSGVYETGTGHVIFSGTAGTQTMITAPLVDSFYDLTHESTSILQIQPANDPVNIAGTFRNLDGQFMANAITMNVEGNWINISTTSPSFIPGGNQVNLIGGDQEIQGETTFYDLNKHLTSAQSYQLVFPSGLEQTVTHQLTLRGYDADNLLALHKSTGAAQAMLNLESAGSQDISFVDVWDNNASGRTLIARNSPDHSDFDTYHVTNWEFGDITITWDGAQDEDWDNPFNWNLGVVPMSGDTVIIPYDDGGLPTPTPLPHQPVLGSDVTVTSVQIMAGASLTLDGHDMAVSGAVTNAGSIVLDGNETFTAGAMTDTGTFRYVGDADGTLTDADIATNFIVGGTTLTTYHGLVVEEENPSSSPDTFIIGAGLTVTTTAVFSEGDVTVSDGQLVTVNGQLTVSGGTLDAASASLDVNDFVLSGGSFSAPDAALAFTVAGDFTRSGGTFDPNEGTVTFDGVDQTIYTGAAGSVAFYSLVKQAAGADTLTLEAGDTFWVSHQLTLRGLDQDTLLTIDSSIYNSPAFLNLATGGIQDIRDVHVVDNNADGGLLLVGQGVNSYGERYSNWIFGATAADLVWDGTPSPLALSHTAWHEPSNWDLGFVPRPGDNVEIPDTTDKPHLTAVSGVVTVASLDLSAAGSALYLDGYGLTVTGSFENDGTIYLTGAETVMSFTQDTDTGTFVYGNDGAGNPYGITFPDAFFNLQFQPSSSATPSVFALNTDLTIYGSLTIAGSSLDAGDDSVDLRGDFVMTGGAFTAPGVTETFTVGGDFTQTTASGFDANGGTVTFNATSITGPTDQVITGTTTFSGLSKRIPSGAQVHQLTLDAAGEQTVTRSLDLGGIDGNPLQLASTVPGTMANLQLRPGGLQDIDYMVVVDSNAYGSAPLPPDPSHALMLVARDSDEISSSNYLNWQFGSVEVVWTGAFDTNWNDARNWDLGLVPMNGVLGISEGDDVRIPDVANMPQLAGPVNLRNMTVEADASIYLGAYDMTLTGTLSNSGNIVLQGNNGALPQHIAIAVPDTDSGTFTYTGDDSGFPIPLGIYDLGGTVYTPRTYFDLVIADTGTPDTFVPAGALEANGTLTVSAGTLDVTNVPLTVDGAFVLNGGTLLAPNTQADPANTFTVNGSWTNTSGTFTTNTGEVIFTGPGDAVVTGDTTFYDLTFIGPAAGKEVTFQQGSNQTVENILDMRGDDTNKLVLHSSTNSTPGNPTDWMLTIMSGTPVVNNVDVRDSTAVFPAGNPTTERYILALNSIDQKNGEVSTNTNWVFAMLDIITPTDSRTVDTLPTIIGRGIPGQPVTLIDGTSSVIATAVADANGNFRVVVGQDDALLGVPVKPALDEGAGNTITPVYNGYAGNSSTDLTVVATTDPPTTTPGQVPVIDEPANGDRLRTPLPTITGQAQPGAHIVVVASNPSDGLLLTMPPPDDAYAGEGIVGMDGTFSVTLTRPLGSGHNFVSVIVDGVSSKIMDYLVNNIRGTVFDAMTNEVIRDAQVFLYNADGTLAVPGTDISAEDPNPFVTGADGQYFFLAITGPFYFRVNAIGYDYPTQLADAELPAGRTVTTGSRGETFMPVGVVLIDNPMDPNASTFRVEKKANKSEARVGEVVTYTVTIENLLQANSVSDTRLVDVIPPGFKYMNGRSQLDGIPMAEPEGNRPLWFNVGNFAPRQTKTLRYQLVIGAGVVPGGYENVATMRYVTNAVLSNRATAMVNVIYDTLFDAGTIFGKVFYDWNENGRQDNPEYLAEDRMEIVEGPVPNVKLVMEDGTTVTADANGQYNIPNILPGRHLVRLDERSLPPGAYLTTDKVQVVDVTSGTMFKVNFGVNMDNAEVVGEDAIFFQKEFAIDQSVTPPRPRLNVDMFNENILLHNKTVIEQIEFRMFTNYAPFLVSWQLDVIDADTKKLVRSFKGSRRNIHDPVFWDGRDSSGEYLRGGARYAYLLKVQDENGKWDETSEQPLALKVMTDDEMTERQRARSEKEKSDEATARARDYRTFLTALAQGNALKTQNIWVKGDTVVLKATAADVRQVLVLRNGELFAEVPVLERHGLTARELIEGGSAAQAVPMEIILPNGDYELEVVSAQGAADLAAAAPAPAVAGVSVVEPVTVKTARYKKTLKVGEDYMMFVAMGDGKVGYNMNRGNIEPVQGSEQYQRGFYTQGKLAYYLKGKIKGKYIVTSSFDTERQRKEALRAFRDEDYYPVYGDSSTVSYEAADTEGPLYLAVDWDKSQAIWGNYAVAFNDVEFANYTRSLYGGKLDYQAVATTDHGDPKTRVVVFHAEVRQRAAHNEFLGTGGSLYYFKHQDIVRGSDKIRLEVRDAVTGLVKSTTEMKEGVDYDVDHASGRVLFWRPVSMLVSSGSLVSNSLLNGDPVYVVADYEYFVEDKLAEATRGGRVTRAVGKGVVLGATYVDETQADSNYRLQGQDVTVHLGKDAVVKAEYAETSSDAQNNYISTDGGITFTELASADNATGRAYGIRQDARLFDRIGLKSYYKWIGDGFSTGSTTSQQGKEMMGLAMTFDLTPVTRLTASQDIQRLIERGNLQTAMQVGAKETTTTLVQLVHESRRLRLTEEFQSVETRGAEGVATTRSNALAAAAEAAYALDEKTDLVLRQEASLSGARTRATTAGIKRQITDKLSASLEETFSQDGTATTIGATANVTPKLALSTDLSLARLGGNATSRIVALGGKGQINDSTSLEAAATVAQTGVGIDENSLTLTATSRVDEDTDVRVGVESARTADASKSLQAVILEGTRKGREGRETTAGVKIEDRPAEGKTTVITAGEKGQINATTQLSSERSFGFGDEGEERGETYTIARTRDGRSVETSYTRKFADTQTEHSDSNIFALSGDVNDRIAVLASLEKGRAMNLDGTIYDRIAVAGALGYVQKDMETGKILFESSTKAEVRLDEGATDMQQYVFYQSAEGRINDRTTVRGKFSYSTTKNMDTGKEEAGYKEIMLGAAYRPVAMDRVNLFGEYTYKENKGPSGQAAASDVEETKMHVLSVGASYELNDKWELVEKLAMRIMDEKVTGFEFTKTHTWLWVNRANYALNQDWKIGAEYRILTVKEARDQKRGLLLEAVHSINDNVELGIGYNFTDFVDDLTDLDYTVQGPFIRMTGKLYDQSPEERARARARWLERRVEIYARNMVKKEVDDPDSRIMVELNRMYRTARAAQQAGKYEESREHYRNIILITQMMYEEAAQFVRQHIAYEERIYNAYQRAQEYYDKGEFWQARKLWEKIVEEASKAVLE